MSSSFSYEICAFPFRSCFPPLGRVFVSPLPRVKKKTGIHEDPGPVQAATRHKTPTLPGGDPSLSHIVMRIIIIPSIPSFRAIIAVSSFRSASSKKSLSPEYGKRLQVICPPRPSSRISCRNWHRFAFAKVAAVSQGLSLRRSGWIDCSIRLLGGIICTCRESVNRRNRLSFARSRRHLRVSDPRPAPIMSGSGPRKRTTSRARSSHVRSLKRTAIRTYRAGEA